MLDKFGFYDKKRVRYFTKIFLLSFFVCFLLLALLDYETVFSQVELDVYFSKATCAIAFIIIMLKSIKPFNWHSLIATIILFVFYCFYITPFREATSILTAARYGVLTQWIVLLIIIDMLLYKKMSFKQYRQVPLALYLSMAFFICYYRLGRKELLILVLPMLFFYSIRLNKERWYQFLLSIYYGCFGSFCVTILKSLKMVSISGEDRWFGYFPTLATFGFFLSCCFSLSLWGFWYVFQKKKTWATPLFFFNSIWMVAILYFGLVAVGTRTFYLVILGELVILICLFWKKIPRIVKAGALLFLVVCVGVFAVSVVYLKSCSEEELEQMIMVMINRYGENGITYTLRSYLRIFMPSYLISNEFSGFWALVDSFTGIRLTIAKAFLNEVSFLPNGIEGVYIGEYFPGHAHNTYIQMAYQFGIPTAILYIGFFVYGFIDRIRAYKKNHEAYNLLLVLWLAMMLTTWITETVIICSVTTIMGLIIMYPFIVNIDDEPEDVKVASEATEEIQNV